MNRRIKVTPEPHVDHGQVDALAKLTPYRPRLIMMSEYPPMETEWIWQSRLPAGQLSLIAGVAGIGKSFFTCDMAARITTTGTWPDGTTTAPGSVLLLTAEDDPNRTIRPRLDACGADVTKVGFLSGMFDPNQPENHDQSVDLGDFDIIRDAAQQMPDLRLIIVDPIGSYLGGRVDAHRDNEVRDRLVPIAKLAEELNAAVVMVAHVRKSVATVADDLVLGSRAFTAMARAVWHVRWDPNDKGRRLFLGGKNNLAESPGGLAYTVTGSPARIEWATDTVDMTADDALAAERMSDTDRTSKTQLDQAVEWLRGSLADGPVAGSKLKVAAEQDGIKSRTLDRAAKVLGVLQKPSGFGRPWTWSLTGWEERHSLDQSSLSRQGNLLGETDETDDTEGD